MFHLQDPVLFGGTICYNLDPFDLYDESDIWRALEQVRTLCSIRVRLISYNKTQTADYYMYYWSENFNFLNFLLATFVKILIIKLENLS